MSHRSQPILNVTTGAGSQREQQWIGFVGQTTQIDGTDDPARHRITNRRSRARETGEHPDVVLAATDEGGPASLQSGANPVGARHLFGQAIARCEANRVQRVEDGHFCGATFKHHAVGRRKDNADSLRSQVLGDALQDRGGRASQPRTLIGFAHVGQLNPVGVNVQDQRPTPRIQDTRLQSVLVDWAHRVSGADGQKLFPDPLDFGGVAGLRPHPPSTSTRLAVT